jgi:hypothetical protein
MKGGRDVRIRVGQNTATGHRPVTQKEAEYQVPKYRYEKPLQKSFDQA